jgi:hypothetical protein
MPKDSPYLVCNIHLEEFHLLLVRNEDRIEKKGYLNKFISKRAQTNPQP